MSLEVLSFTMGSIQSAAKLEEKIYSYSPGGQRRIHHSLGTPHTYV